MSHKECSEKHAPPVGRGQVWCATGLLMVLSVALAASILAHQNPRTASVMIWNRQMCGPRLIVIGTQKGGTTSLYKYIKNVTWISVGKTKELHFFDKVYKSRRKWDTLNDLKALQQKYLKDFGLDVIHGGLSLMRESRDDTCTDYRTGLTFCCDDPNTVYSDVTPRYMIIPQAPRLIRHITNNPWIVALLREPAARAVSHFRMEFGWEDGKDPEEFASEFHQNVQRGIKVSKRCLSGQNIPGVDCQRRLMDHDVDMVSRGLYARHLAPWFSTFGREKLVLWVSERFSDDPEGHLISLQNQIVGANVSLSREIFQQDYNVKYNVDVQTVEPWESTVNLLREFYEPYNREIVYMLMEWGYYDVARDIRKLWDISLKTA